MNAAAPHSSPAASCATPSRAARWLLRALIVALCLGYVGATLHWRRAGRNFIREDRLVAAPTVAAGERLSLRAAERNPAALLWGWAPPQEDANWTYGARAEIGFRCAHERTPRRAIVVIQDSQFPPEGGAQVIEVTLNGRRAARWTIEPGSAFPLERIVELPDATVAPSDVATSPVAAVDAPAAAGARQTTVIGFLPETVLVPLQLGRSGDPRQLGFAVREIRFE